MPSPVEKKREKEKSGWKKDKKKRETFRSGYICPATSFVCLIRPARVRSGWIGPTSRDSVLFGCRFGRLDPFRLGQAGSTHPGAFGYLTG